MLDPRVRRTLAGLAEAAAIATMGEPDWYTQREVLPLVADAHALLADGPPLMNRPDSSAPDLIVEPCPGGYRAYLVGTPEQAGCGRSTVTALTDWLLSHGDQVGLTITFLNSKGDV